MKKLLWCGGALGICALILLITALRNPDNAIIGISQSSSKYHSELLIVKRDHTYEQLVRFKDEIISHQGSWIPSREDPASQSLGAHTGTDTSNYITFQEMLSGSTKGNLEPIDSLRPAMMNDTTPKLLKE
jgi:hypothetical protein